MKKIDMARLAVAAVAGYYVYTKYIKKPTVTITDDSFEPTVTITADSFDSSSPQALSISTPASMSTDQLMMAGYGRRR